MMIGSKPYAKLLGWGPLFLPPLLQFPPLGVVHPYKVVTYAGKTCYASFRTGGHNLNLSSVSPSETIEDHEKYVRRIIDQGHESVLEHVHYSFEVRASEVCLNELVRHRHLSFSVESGRYVRPYRPSFLLPEELPQSPATDAIVEFVTSAVTDIADKWSKLQHRLHNDESFQSLPFDVKKALTSYMRRALLKSRMMNAVVTGNVRAWRHVIKARTSEHAEVEIRELVQSIAAQIREHAPAFLHGID